IGGDLCSVGMYMLAEILVGLVSLNHQWLIIKCLNLVTRPVIANHSLNINVKKECRNNTRFFKKWFSLFYQNLRE
ncbi:hypothetical protein, partial [Acinetobacter junii]|uniref:hypothetical protein n=1 Tax=Acinetobacter junii TaxID=40215 RepID=UPI0030F9C56C